MNKDYKWKEFVIRKAVEKAHRLANTQELTKEEDIQMAKGAAIIHLLDTLPTIDIIMDMVTQRDIFNEVDTDTAYSQWCEMVDTHNSILDTAFSIAKTIFNEQTISDFRDRFEIQDFIDELNHI